MSLEQCATGAYILTFVANVVDVLSAAVHENRNARATRNSNINNLTNINDGTISYSPSNDDRPLVNLIRRVDNNLTSATSAEEADHILLRYALFWSSGTVVIAAVMALLLMIYKISIYITASTLFLITILGYSFSLNMGRLYLHTRSKLGMSPCVQCPRKNNVDTNSKPCNSCLSFVIKNTHKAHIPTVIGSNYRAVAEMLQKNVVIARISGRKTFKDLFSYRTSEYKTNIAISDIQLIGDGDSLLLPMNLDIWTHQIAFRAPHISARAFIYGVFGASIVYITVYIPLPPVVLYISVTLATLIMLSDILEYTYTTVLLYDYITRPALENAAYTHIAVFTCALSLILVSVTVYTGIDLLVCFAVANSLIGMIYSLSGARRPYTSRYTELLVGAILVMCTPYTQTYMLAIVGGVSTLMTSIRNYLEMKTILYARISLSGGSHGMVALHAQTGNVVFVAIAGSAALIAATITAQIEWTVQTIVYVAFQSTITIGLIFLVYICKWITHKRMLGFF